MKTAVVRVSTDTHASVRELAQEQGASIPEVLERAVKGYATKCFFDNADEAYARLQADPEAWTEELEERRVSENTLMDDLEGDEWEE